MRILNSKQCEKFISLAVNRLKQYIKKNNLNGITTGISGGIDSAVVGVIGLRSGLKFKYYFLDCESDPRDYKKAQVLAQHFKFKLERVDLTDWYKKSPLLDSIDIKNEKSAIAKGNIKARLRMISLYQSALLNNFIYLDTGDFSEKLVGFWTRHGDEGDIKIIQNVTKTEVYDLGEYLNLPGQILKSRPGDGIGITKNNFAVEQLGLDYIYIEYILSRFVEQGFDYNGSVKQLKLAKFLELKRNIAKRINKPANAINKIIERSLATSYKRKYGDYACHLIGSRKDFGFLKFGTKAFSQKYFDAIID